MRFAPVVAFGGLLVFLCGFTPVADANSFRGSAQPQDGLSVLSAESEHELLAELEVALGSGHRHATERRLKRIEQMLNPMFAAMSKNENGRLGPAAGGYMLHRLFVQRHGWVIRALEPEGNSMAGWNSSLPTSALEEKVPEHVVDLFEKRLGTHGLGVKELAVLASSIEHLVHTEALDRLKLAYLALGFAEDAELSQEEAIEALDMYMSIYLLSHGDLTNMTTRKAQNMRGSVERALPNWLETQQFLRDIYQSVAPKRDYVHFNEIENVIAEVGERFGRFQDIECRQLKDWLVEGEDRSVGGAGRVRLADFYKKALHEGKWHFSESADYLRQLGALDESDASNPRVIIPNYIYGRSNCVASSAFYSVCCIDECESILGRLEELALAPEATPSMITSLIAKIPSSTVAANRTLSSWLHQRLDEVAKHHGGLVPLHGRLFAQWLHYAYPRECPFPHVSGMVDPLSPEVALTERNRSFVSLPVSEMRRIIEDAPQVKSPVPWTDADAIEDSSMWSMDEELVVWRAPREPVVFQRFGYVRGLFMLGAALSFSVALARRPNQKSSMESKYFV
jgi:diadenosine tetraphosphatase ApaH/serine/threonine PP2A family protein phosphatase